MAYLNLPDRVKVAILRINTLPEETTKSLLSTLEKITSSVKFYDIRNQIVSLGVDGLSSGELSALVDALLSLYSIKASSGKSEAEISADVLYSLNASDSSKQAVSDSQAASFQEKLARLLSVETIAISSKAIVLHAEYQRIYGSARVITDIRPVFGKDSDFQLAGAFINYNLKIDFLESGKPQEIFLALDHQDVDELIEVLTRAKKKSEILRQTVSSTLTIFNNN